MLQYGGSFDVPHFAIFKIFGVGLSGGERIGGKKV